MRQGNCPLIALRLSQVHSSFLSPIHPANCCIAILVFINNLYYFLIYLKIPVNILNMGIERRPLPLLLELGAEFNRQGLSVRSDWRYDLVVDYLKASPSYLALRNEELKYKNPWGLPSDYLQVKQVFDDFGPIYKMREAEWWTTIGMHLYGVKAADPKVEVVAELNEANPKTTVAKNVADSLVVQIPLSIT